MSSNEYPLKHVRLQQIYEAGFNVADFICFPPNEFNEDLLRSFFAKHGKVSCRHFHSDEKRNFACPFLRDVTDVEKAVNFCKEHNRTYFSLINENLVTADSIYAGNVWLKDDRNYLIEYFEGPGTPRDLENMDADRIKHFKREIGEPMDQSAPEALKRLAYNFQKLVPHIRPVMLEFSVYPYAVGRRRSNEVCWEWRWAV
jgi:hypothetical protein